VFGVTLADRWLWNQIPVTIGNFIGGFILTGLSLHLVNNNRRRTEKHPAPVKNANF
jgi:formate transporter